MPRVIISVDMDDPSPSLSVNQVRRGELGLTIVELLVVMSILAVIAGVGVGMMTRRDRTLETEASARLIRAQLRLARASALRAGTGSVVRIDREEQTVIVHPVEVAGNWHLEDDRGSRNLRMIVAGSFVEGGVLGNCMKLAGDSADLGGYPFFDVREGFRLALWVNAESGKPGKLAVLDQAFELSVNDAGALEAELSLGKQGDEITLRTRPGVVVPGTWTRVALAYDRVEATLSAKNVVYARRRDDRPVGTVPNAHLHLGGNDFAGLLDEVRLDVVGEGNRAEIATRLEVVEGSDVLIRFDGRGRLDSRVHPKAARIALKNFDEEDGADIAIRIERSGVIR